MNAQIINKQIDEIVAFIEKKTDIKPELGFTLSSALAEVTSSIEDQIVIPYTDLPHLPTNSHDYTTPGNLIIGKLGGKNVIVMQGRLLLFDGHSPQTATLLIRVMRKMGVKTIFIISTAGGLNYHFRTGEIMLITDHVNFTGYTPLLGENLDNFGPRLCPMFDIYDLNLQQITRNVATENRIQLCQGVYAGILGPQFPTRAELRIFLENNCDAVGMSVIQESIVAAHSGMKILGLILITDMALPYSVKQATSEEIATQSKQALNKVKTLIVEVTKNLKMHG